MKILSDGRASIGIEATSGKIRLLSGAPTADDTHPPFNGNATYIRLSNDELVICNMVATAFSRAQFRLITGWARAEGYRWIYADRVQGHRLPAASRRLTRPLLGWYEIDLHKLIPHPKEPQCV